MGSIVLISRVTTASPVAGAGYETDAIMSVVVGGTALAGGTGRPRPDRARSTVNYLVIQLYEYAGRVYLSADHHEGSRSCHRYLAG